MSFTQTLRASLNAGLDRAEAEALEPQAILNDMMRGAAALSVANAGPMATAEALRDLADQIDREFTRKH